MRQVCVVYKQTKWCWLHQLHGSFGGLCFTSHHAVGGCMEAFPWGSVLLGGHLLWTSGVASPRNPQCTAARDHSWYWANQVLRINWNILYNWDIIQIYFIIYNVIGQMNNCAIAHTFTQNVNILYFSGRKRSICMSSQDQVKLKPEPEPLKPEVNAEKSTMMESWWCIRITMDFTKTFATW